MKCAKNILKLVGVLIVAAAAVLVVLKHLEEIKSFFRTSCLSRARREELKDYAD